MKTGALPGKTKGPTVAGGRAKSLALEESELRYRRLFETAQDGILIIDARSGRVLDANPFLIDLLDYPFESMIGLRLWEIDKFKEIAASPKAFQILQANDYLRYENIPLRTKGEKTIRVEFASNVYYVGRHKVIQCTIRDVSGRTDLRKSRDRVAALELAGEEKDRVVALLFHELRAPLTAISSMIDLVEMEHPVPDRIDQPEISPQFDPTAVALIRRNVGTLVNLMNELLDVSQIAQGAVEVELARLDMHEAICLVLQNFENQRKTKPITIDLQLNAVHHYIQADEVKLQQILSNLIGNAFKFTPQAGNVSIISRNEGDELIVEISDSGIGIPAGALERIFSPFEQGDPSIHSRFGGLGLGLSIAHSLVAANRGTLRAHSEGSGYGATFTLRFNAQSSLEEPLSFESDYRHRPDIGSRILLVEDNDDARRCLRRLLEAKGHKVRAAADCRAAMELSDWHDFDILVADLGLPDGSGIDLLHHMRQSAPHVQGIAISGFGMPHHLASTKAAGFVAHLVKPIEFVKLAAMIEELPVAEPLLDDGI